MKSSYDDFNDAYIAVEYFYYERKHLNYIDFLYDPLYQPFPGKIY